MECNGGLEMSDRVILAFTVEGEDLIRERGWSGYWPVNVNRAKEFSYVLFCQNLNLANAKREEWKDFATGTKPHSSGFLLASIADVVPSLDLDRKRGAQSRRIFILGEVARIELPDIWKGWRFPINYECTLQDLGLDPTRLLFEPLSPPVAAESAEATQTTPMSDPVGETEPTSALADIEKYAAERLGVRLGEVEITITLLPRRRAA
jgi:hypothetical protein